MNNVNDVSSVTLCLTVRQSVTVLPRCLQILSRRGFTLLELSTEPTDGGFAKLTMVVKGNRSWHSALPHLLQRVIDIKEVAMGMDHAR
jgi:acetolactate synthase regulatory subunit